MDLNLYLGLPPLPRPPGRLGSSMDCPAPAVPEPPRTDEDPAPEEMSPPIVVYSPSDALSEPGVPPIDPMLVDWLDGVSTDSEDAVDGGDPPSHDSSVSPPPPPPALGSVSPLLEAPTTDEAAGFTAAEEMSPPIVVYSSDSDELSEPGVPIDPMLVDWLDGVSTDSEDAVDGGDPADPPSHDSSVSPPPPLPPALGWVSSMLEAPAADGPGFTAAEEILPLVDSPLDIWSIDHSLLGWLDGSGTDSEEGLDAGEPAAAFDAPSHDAVVSSQPLLPLAGLEGVRVEWVERLLNPDQVAPVAETEMVSTRQSVGGAIEEAAPELRLQRLIQVSEQHRIVRPGTVNRSQRATSPEAERLAQAIQRSHSSLDVSRRLNIDSAGKMGGIGAVKKDGSCGGCNSSFECNICLDAAKEPVVTPCGHLFCWPCLYQWLHRHSIHSECPVCKGEVLEVNVTPIYGRGGGERDASSNDVPPRPSANRSESLSQQLQAPDPRVIANMVRRLMGNQDHLRGQAAPPTGGAEVPLVPEGGPTRVINRVGVRRQQRPIPASPSFNSPSPLTRLMRRNAAPEGANPVQIPWSYGNAAPAVPQQSSSVEQASTSSTVAVIVGQAAQSRRSRPPTDSTTTTTRRTRRRQQH